MEKLSTKNQFEAFKKSASELVIVGSMEGSEEMIMHQNIIHL